MAHYLDRAFRDDPKTQVLHGLHITDSDQPEQTGTTGVCQIDHLIVHRWGMFIIETKSVSGTIRVRPDGTGGDEWQRVSGAQETGMPSPIQQARRQADFLRNYLQPHHTDLLGRQPIGLRTITKLQAGTDQRSFRHMPIQLIVAISDKAIIDKQQGWSEPQKPFRVFLAKADQVPAKIARELDRHRAGSAMLNPLPTGEYGIWRTEGDESLRIAQFLAAQHVPPGPSFSARSSRTTANGPIHSSTAEPPPPATPHPTPEIRCECGSSRLTAHWNYGHYWRCNDCKNTWNMPCECSNCPAVGKRGKPVRIRKQGPDYFRQCDDCQHSELLWTQR